MKLYPILLFTLSLIYTGLPVQAQTVVPVEVFVEHDKEAETATIYFTSPVSGLSNVVTVEGVQRHLFVLDMMTLTTRGVLYTDPVTGQVSLATPDGQTRPHPFIPQEYDGLIDVQWVLSPDRYTIAWVEYFYAQSGVGWMAKAYIADIDGEVITPLPPMFIPPDTDTFSYRVMPLHITNDGELFFYDAAFPAEPPTLTDYFVEYQDIHVFVNSRQTYQDLPGEPGCLCGAATDSQGHIFLRTGNAQNGYLMEYWNLDNNSLQFIPPLDTPLAYAGDIFIPEKAGAEGSGLNPTLAFYTLAHNLDSEDFGEQFGLVLVNLTQQTQRILPISGAERWRVVDMLDGGEALLMVSVYGDGTYKMNLATLEINQVAIASWLGVLYVN